VSDSDDYDRYCAMGEGIPDEEEPDRAFDVVLPDPDPKADPGWRLHIFREPGELTQINLERVLPEKVADPKAHRVMERRGLGWLTAVEVRWLRDQLTRLVMTIEEEANGE
jgi:hypothetical protein